MPRRLDRLGTALIAAAIGLCGYLPAPALAARLIGGRQQAAVARTFSRLRSERGRAIVSIRSSSVAPAWTVVTSVVPDRTGQTSRSPSTLSLRRTFLHRVGTRERLAVPPAVVARDLRAPFSVAVVYAGRGSESVAYQQTYRSVCSGGGGFVEAQDAGVGPASFSVRYVVDLDHVLSAVRNAQATTIIPEVSYDSAGSRLSATEHLSRSDVDHGCFSPPTHDRCVRTFHLTGGGAANDLGFDPGLGIEVALPLASSQTGDCRQDDYTLGPTLWDSGATTVQVPTLGLTEGRLPGNPYAAIKVSWPFSSALAGQGFLAGPCQGNPAGCTDTLQLSGTVRLQAVSGG